MASITKKIHTPNSSIFKPQKLVILHNNKKVKQTTGLLDKATCLIRPPDSLPKGIRKQASQCIKLEIKLNNKKDPRTIVVHEKRDNTGT